MASKIVRWMVRGLLVAFAAMLVMIFFAPRYAVLVMWVALGAFTVARFYLFGAFPEMRKRRWTIFAPLTLVLLMVLEAVGMGHTFFLALLCASVDVFSITRLGYSI